MMRVQAAKKGTMKRVLKTLFKFYPVMLPITVVCIIFSAIVNAIPAIFQQNVIALVEQSWATGDWASVRSDIIEDVVLLAVFYGLSLLSGVAFNQMMAIITQGSLKKLRTLMFNGMQDLPIKYFDTHNHGDIMSYYTNDIDALRQMISQSFPQLLMSAVVVLTVFIIMLYYSIWLTIAVLAGVVVMVLITEKNRRQLGSPFLPSAGGNR